MIPIAEHERIKYGEGAFVAARPLLLKERLVNNFAKLTQFVTWPFLFLIFHIAFQLDIRGRRNFRDVKSPFIIIANHVSFSDCFLFRLTLGLWTRHLPLRFMAVKKFDWPSLNFLAKIGVIDFIYSLFGVFTVVPGRGLERNLQQAKEILAEGGNVVIYPEGKIPKHEGLAPFHRGAAVLAEQTGLSVVPVSFRLVPHWFRRKMIVNVGGPLTVIPGQSVEEVTKSFFEDVNRLHERV